MPYICLARNDIPDGTLQVLDLWPNTSQRNQSIDPPGQTRYVRRTRRDRIAVGLQTGTATGGIGTRAASGELSGLEAYLLDRVEPGATEVATGTITFAAQANVGDRVVIKGIIFEAGAGANPANWNAPAAGTDANPFIFGAGADANDCASNLTLAINDIPNVQAAILAAAPDAGVSRAAATNAGAPDPNVLLTAEDNLAAPLPGTQGDLTVTVTVGGARITEPVVQRMSRTNEAWTDATLFARANAIQAVVDAGTALTLAILDAGPQLGAVGADLTGAAATSGSTGTVLELLSILAGRDYRLDVGAQVFTAAVAPDTAHLWAAAQLGSFTDAVTVFDSQMLQGEIRPLLPYTKFPNNSHARSQVNNVAGGSVVQQEFGNARYTVPGGSAEASVLSGDISRMQDASVTLVPDADYSAFHDMSAATQASPQTAEVNNARLVTTYDDDGSLL